MGLVVGVDGPWRERDAGRGWEDAHGQRRGMQGPVGLGDEA